LNEFFIKTESGWYHDRCEEVIDDYKANTSQKSQAGKASAAKREAKRQHALSVRSTDVETQVERALNGTPTNQEPETKNQKPIIPPTPKGDDKEDDCISKLRSLFRMREATPLSKKDKTSLKNGESIFRTASNEEWELLEWHHSQPKGSGQPGEFCKGSISALLNDWNGALNNARKSKSNTTHNRHTPEKSKYADAF